TCWPGRSRNWPPACPNRADPGPPPSSSTRRWTPGDTSYPRIRGFVMEDVIVVGAGPTGLMLATELALAGIRPVVLEKLTGPRAEQRANGLVGQIVRMMDRRGLFEKLAGTTGPPRPATGFMFGAFPMPFGELPDNPVYTQLVPQA